MKSKLIFYLFILLLLTSCKKETKQQQVCWQAFNPEFATIETQLKVCDTPLARLEEKYSSLHVWWFDASEPLHCWLANFNNSGHYLYLVDKPKSMMDKYAAQGTGSRFAEIPCSSFCNWAVKEISKSKITNFTSTLDFNETLFDDTCSKLYPNRVVVFRETTDSIITRTFLYKF